MFIPFLTLVDAADDDDDALLIVPPKSMLKQHAQSVTELKTRKTPFLKMNKNYGKGESRATQKSLPFGKWT